MMKLVLGSFCILSLVHAQQGVLGERIRADVKFLSSDLLEGRGVGTRGGDLATEYIAAQLAIAGAHPAGDNGTYFQRVPLVGVTTQPDAELKASKGGKTVSFKWQDEFVGSSYRQVGKENVEGELGFCGHGPTDTDYNWDHF